jgi:hypothetical protein
VNVNKQQQLCFFCKGERHACGLSKEKAKGNSRTQQ